MTSQWKRGVLAALALSGAAFTAQAGVWTQTFTPQGGYVSFNNGTVRDFIHIMDQNSGFQDYGSGWVGGTYATSSDWDLFNSTNILTGATLSLRFWDDDNRDEELRYRIEANDADQWSNWSGEFDFDENGNFGLPNLFVGLNVLDNDLLAFSIKGEGGDFRFMGSTLEVQGHSRTTSVPEPTTLGLLGLGLVGLGVIRRRKAA